jgi:hypothetical protein
MVRSALNGHGIYTMQTEMGPWDTSALDTLHQWDPAWSKAAEKMTANPWTGSLERKTVELICVAVNAACTSLNPERSRISRPR